MLFVLSLEFLTGLGSGDEQAKQVGEKIVKGAQKNRERQRREYHYRRQPDGFLAARPGDLPKFLPRFHKKIFDFI